MVYVTHDQVEAMTLADRLVILDQGRLQQVDTPTALYERPGNRFVAGFVGWPTMNLLEGQLLPEGNQLSFRTSGGSWRIPQPLAAAWAAQSHRPVTLGLRPEAVQLAQTEGFAATQVMEVALVEPLGRGVLVTLRERGCQLTALVDDRQGLAPAQRVKVAMNLHKAHLFDGVSGLVLYNSRPAG
jgi:multiple sugar transport system ATP-binding protein